MNVIRDFDPGDERDDFVPHHHVLPSDGLCSFEWCDDAALPGEDYCRSCYVEVLTLEARVLSEKDAA